MGMVLCDEGYFSGSLIVGGLPVNNAANTRLPLAGTSSHRQAKDVGRQLF